MTRRPGDGTEPGIGPGFGWLWLASTAGNLGDGLGRVAIVLLAAGLTRDPLAVSVIAALSYLPSLVVGLPAGALIDRFDRRRLAVVAGTARTVAITLLAVAAATDLASLWLLYAVVVLLYTCETFYDNAVVAMLPALVTRPDNLERANGRLQSAQVLAERFVGPPLASSVFALGAAYAFGLHAACYALAAVWLLSLPGTYRTRTGPAAADARPSIRREISEGLRYLWNRRLHRLLLGLMLGAYGGASMVNAIIVLWTLEVLGISEALYGAFVLTSAAGAILGSQTAAPLASRAGRGRTIRLTLIVFGASGLLAASTTSPYLAVIAMVGVGWASVTFTIVNVSLRQRITPAELLGRVTATYRSTTAGVMVTGAVVGGVIASLGGLRLTLLLFGVGCLLLTAVATRVTDDLVNRAIADAAGRTADAGRSVVGAGTDGAPQGGNDTEVTDDR